MKICQALPADYARICALAAANYEKNLSPSDRQQGFLSAKFSLQQVINMATDLGIIVAKVNDRVVGFVCASRCDWNDQPPIVKSMLAEFDRILCTYSINRGHEKARQDFALSESRRRIISVHGFCQIIA